VGQISSDSKIAEAIIIFFLFWVNKNFLLVVFLEDFFANGAPVVAFGNTLVDESLSVDCSHCVNCFHADGPTPGNLVHSLLFTHPLCICVFFMSKPRLEHWCFTVLVITKILRPTPP